VLEETPGIPRSDRRDRRAHRSHQSLPAPGFGLSQDVLDLRESFFDGIEVRRVGRQVEQLASPLLDQFPNLASLIRREDTAEMLTPKARGLVAPIHRATESCDAQVRV
jgi:hypothetical protein